MSSQALSNGLFRAEHVGSFLRPDELLKVRGAWNDKKATDAELKVAEDKAVNQIVELQQDLGFHGINDGEYRRHMFWGTLWSNLDGMKENTGPDPEIFRPYVPDVAAFLEVRLYPCCSWQETLYNVHTIQDLSQERKNKRGETKVS